MEIRVERQYETDILGFTPVGDEISVSDICWDLYVDSVFKMRYYDKYELDNATELLKGCIDVSVE